MKCHVAILGAGSFGLALSKIISEQGHQVSLWTRREEVAQEININHCHPQKLQQVVLPSNIFASADIEEVVERAEMIVSTLPMIALRHVFHDVSSCISNKSLVVSTTKGIECETLSFSSDVLLDIFGLTYRNKICFLSGPSFALELAKGLPTALTLAAYDMKAAQQALQILGSDVLRIYTSNDVIGLEVSGAMKNVIAIAAGIAEGLELGANAKAALITRGLAEMSRLVLAMNGSLKTVNGLAGVGDLMLTCYGNLSRNRAVGLDLAQGVALPVVLANLGQVAEGVNTAKSIPALCQRFAIEMPIMHGVYRILFESAQPQEVMMELLRRPIGFE